MQLIPFNAQYYIDRGQGLEKRDKSLSGKPNTMETGVDIQCHNNKDITTRIQKSCHILDVN